MTPAQLAAVSFLARYAGHTHELYTYQLRRWFQWCDSNDLDPLLGIHVGAELCVRSLGGAGMMASSVNTMMHGVRGFFRFAHIDGTIPADRGLGSWVPADQLQVKAAKRQRGAAAQSQRVGSPAGPRTDPFVVGALGKTSPVTAVKVAPGGQRGPRDGSRRFTPVNYSFDTRANVLSTVILEAWEPAIQEQWRANQAAIREQLIHEYGAADHEQKIANFVDLGAEPWSVVALHNIYLREVRAAFASMNYYPALLGACGLGERILNQLVLTLRDDYADHEATKQVAGKKALDDWARCIKTLRAWGVFDDQVGKDYLKLMDQRHGAVNYRSELDSGDAREAALDAVLLLGQIVEALFTPLGSKPYFFTGPVSRALFGWLRKATHSSNGSSSRHVFS
jgi:hypothetical protein